MDGEGQWKDWEKKKKEEKLAANRRRGPMARKRADKGRGRRNKKGQEDEETDIKPPHWFDLSPFLEAFKKFTASHANVRTQVRHQLEKKEKIVRMMFCHENGEPNVERCQDILTFAEKLNSDHGFEIEQEHIDVFGNILECFGGCLYSKEVK